MKDSQKAAFGLPYSPVRQVPSGFVIYAISGHTGIDVPTMTAPSDIHGQIEMLFRNMADTLRSHGLGFDNVVETTVFVTDITNHYDAVNEAFHTYFGDPKPARSVVGVLALPPVAKNTPLLIEINAHVAVKP
jgi:2-iminobutanoate/2-iminopropanoate deaminase